MYKCETCNKKFDTKRQLIGHNGIHRVGGRYSASRKTIGAKIHSCMFCKIEFLHSHSSTNKFCSQECSAKFQWECISIPKIELGLGGNVKRYLKEKHGDKCFECGQENTWNNKPLM